MGQRLSLLSVNITIHGIEVYGIHCTYYIILHILKKGRNMDSKVTKTHRYRENQEKESEREGYRIIYLHLMCMGKHTK